MPLPAEHWFESRKFLISPFDHEQDLDVLAADVADDVHVAAVLDGRHHVRDGLHDVHVGAQRLLQHVGGISRGAEAQHLEHRALVVDERSDPGEQLLGVRDRVALRELILLGEQLAALVDEHGLGRRGTAVHADDASDDLAGRERRRR